MIDWQTILTSVLLSSTIVSGFLFLFKKTFEKGIETKFKEIENRQRLNLEENKRRQGKVFDDQYELGKSILGLTYRVRNVYREIIDELNESDYNLLFIKDRFVSQNEYYKSLEILLLDNRAILPKVLFKELHDLKHCISYFSSSLHFLISGELSNNKEKVSQLITSCQETYDKIDDHYIVITGIIQSSLGVEGQELHSIE